MGALVGMSGRSVIEDLNCLACYSPSGPADRRSIRFLSNFYLRRVGNTAAVDVNRAGKLKTAVESDDVILSRDRGSRGSLCDPGVGGRVRIGILSGRTHNQRAGGSARLVVTAACTASPLTF